MIDNTRTVLFEYEQILLGKRTTLKVGLNKDMTLKKREDAAGIIWRYAITQLLGWSAEDALFYLTPTIVKQLKMDCVYNALELSQSFDYRYLLSKAFPGKIKYDFTMDTISEYEKVLYIGLPKPKENEKKNAFRKKFFSNADGSKRAAICLKYAIQRFIGVKDIAELYEFFADTPNARKWLNEVKLGQNARILYSSPLDYFHYSLSLEQQNFFLYYFYKFSEEFKAAETRIAITDKVIKKLKKAYTKNIDNEEKKIAAQKRILRDLKSLYASATDDEFNDIVLQLSNLCNEGIIVPELLTYFES